MIYDVKKANCTFAGTFSAQLENDEWLKGTELESLFRDSGYEIYPHKVFANFISYKAKSHGTLAGIVSGNSEVY